MCCCYEFECKVLAITLLMFVTNRKALGSLLSLFRFWMAAPLMLHDVVFVFLERFVLLEHQVKSVALVIEIKV